MEISWKWLNLCLGLFLFQLCNGFPINLEDSVADQHTQLLTGLVAVLLTVCSVVFLAGCLCCRRRNGFKEFRDSPVLASASSDLDHGHVNPIANGEFTIFTPLSSSPYNNSVFLANERIITRTAEDFIYEDFDVSSWFNESEKDFPRINLKYIKELGRGWFGKVVEGAAKEVPPNEEAWSPVVVRILDATASRKERVLFLNDAAIYRCGSHPNILSLIGRCLDTVPLLLLQEYCPQGDLKRYLRSKKDNVEQLLCTDHPLLWCCQLTSALKHLHSNKVTHPDLATRNCQLTTDLTLKLGDYGLAESKYPEDYYQGSPRVPVRWCSPESLTCTPTTIQPKKHTTESNIWSLGVTVWEICECGEQPYSALSDDEVVSQVLGPPNLRLSRPSFQVFYTDYLYRLMQMCWTNAESRPTVTQIDLMLSDLWQVYKNTKNSDDFDRRWESFEPKSNLAASIVAKPLSPSLSNLHGSLEDLLESGRMGGYLENTEMSSSESSDQPNPKQKKSKLKSKMEHNMSDSALFCQRTSSESETEDENWRKKVERGAYTEKVRLKSRSVADLMVLTHVDYSESDTETPLPSLDYRVNYKNVRYAPKSNLETGLTYGSEGNLLSVHDTFQEELKKLKEERRDSLLFVPDNHSQTSNKLGDNSSDFPASGGDRNPVFNVFSGADVNSKLDNKNFVESPSADGREVGFCDTSEERISDFVTETYQTAPTDKNLDTSTEHDFNRPTEQQSENTETGDDFFGLAGNLTEESTPGVSSPQNNEHEKVVEAVNSVIVNNACIPGLESDFLSSDAPNLTEASRSETVTDIVEPSDEEESECEFIKNYRMYNKILKGQIGQTEESELISETYGSEELSESCVTGDDSDFEEYTETDLMDEEESNLGESEVSTDAEGFPEETNTNGKQLDQEVDLETFLKRFHETHTEALLERFHESPTNLTPVRLRYKNNFHIVKSRQLGSLSPDDMDNYEIDHREVLKRDPDVEMCHVCPRKNKNVQTQTKSSYLGGADFSEETNMSKSLEDLGLRDTSQNKDVDLKKTNIDQASKGTMCPLELEESMNINGNCYMYYGYISESPKIKNSVPALQKCEWSVPSCDSPEFNSIDKWDVYPDTEFLYVDDIHGLKKVIPTNTSEGNKERNNIQISEESESIQSKKDVDLNENCGQNSVEELKNITSEKFEIESNIPFNTSEDNEEKNNIHISEENGSIQNKNGVDLNENCEQKPVEDFKKDEAKSDEDTFLQNLTMYYKILKGQTEQIEEPESVEDFKNNITPDKLEIELNIPTNVSEDNKEKNHSQISEHNESIQSKKDVDLNENCDQKSAKDLKTNITPEKLEIESNIPTNISEDNKEKNNTQISEGSESIQNKDVDLNENCGQKSVNLINNTIPEKLEIESNIPTNISEDNKAKSNIHIYEESKSIQNKKGVDLNENCGQKSIDLINNTIPEQLDIESNIPTNTSEDNEEKYHNQISEDNESIQIKKDDDLNKNCEQKAMENLKNNIIPEKLEIESNIPSNTSKDNEEKNHNQIYEGKESIQNKKDIDLNENCEQKSAEDLKNNIIPEKLESSIQISEESESIQNKNDVDLIENCEQKSVDLKNNSIPEKLEIKSNIPSNTSEDNEEKNHNQISEDKESIQSKNDVDLNENCEQKSAEDLKNNITPEKLEIESNIATNTSEDNKEEKNIHISEGNELIQNKKDVDLNENCEQKSIEDLKNNTTPKKLEIESNHATEEVPNVIQIEQCNNCELPNTDVNFKYSEDNLNELGKQKESHLPISDKGLESKDNCEQKDTKENTHALNCSVTNLDNIDQEQRVSDDIDQLRIFTSTPTKEKENLSEDQQNLNSSPLDTNKDLNYSLETWDNFLGRTLDAQQDIQNENLFDSFSSEPHSLLFVENGNELVQPHECADAKKEDEDKINDRTFVIEDKNDNTFTIDKSELSDENKDNTAESEIEDSVDNTAWGSGGGWFLHPQTSTKEPSGTIEVRETTGSYVGFGIDDEVMAAIRNELLNKLPHAQVAPSEKVTEMEEWDTAEKNEVFLKYNIYNPPLSPILEESYVEESEIITPKQESDNEESEWSEHELPETLPAEPESHTYDSQLKGPHHRHTPSQDSCCSNDTLFNLEELTCAEKENDLTKNEPEPEKTDLNTETNVIEVDSENNTNTEGLNNTINQENLTYVVLNSTNATVEEDKTISVKTEDKKYVDEFISQEIKHSSEQYGKSSDSSNSDPNSSQEECPIAFKKTQVAPLPSPEDNPWKQLPASLLSYDKVISQNNTLLLPPTKSNNSVPELHDLPDDKDTTESQPDSVTATQPESLSTEIVQPVYENVVEREPDYENVDAKVPIYENIADSQPVYENVKDSQPVYQNFDVHPDVCNEVDYVNIVNLENSKNSADYLKENENKTDNDKGEDIYGMLTDIKFNGPTENQLISTSFSESNDINDEQDWDSGSDTRSSSSGEFIWKEGEHEESLKALRAAPQDVLETVRPMEGITEESTDESDVSGSTSDEEGEVPEFVPSAWDKFATPTKSALRSPEKTLEKSEKNKSKGVWFKKQKYHCVYEYPREPESPVLQSQDLWKPQLDYSSFTDWEFDGDTYFPSSTVDDNDATFPSGYNYQPKTISSRNLYQLTSISDFIPSNAGLEDEFFVSSSARPFDATGNLSSQFFPGSGTWTAGENATPDSGVEDSTPGSSTELNDFKTPDPVPESLKKLASEAVKKGKQMSIKNDSLGGLRHTRNKLKLDLPPSPSAFTSTKMFMMEPTLEPVIREKPTFTTFGKSRFSVQHVDTPPDESKNKNVSFEALPYKPMKEDCVKTDSYEKYILKDKLDCGKGHSEYIRGEASLLDSADEDSGIESSTLERKMSCEGLSH